MNVKIKLLYETAKYILKIFWIPPEYPPEEKSSRNLMRDDFYQIDPGEILG